MANDERTGRKLMLAILAVHLAASLWLFVRFPDKLDTAQLALRALFALVIPGGLWLLAFQGRSWARWWLAGWFIFLIYGHGTAALDIARAALVAPQSQRAFLVERRVTSVVLAVTYSVAVLVLLLSPAVRAVVAPAPGQTPSDRSESNTEDKS